jgi:hypothetical protein
LIIAVCVDIGIDELYISTLAVGPTPALGRVIDPIYTSDVPIKF